MCLALSLVIRWKHLDSKWARKIPSTGDISQLVTNWGTPSQKICSRMSRWGLSPNVNPLGGWMRFLLHEISGKSWETPNFPFSFIFIEVSGTSWMPSLVWLFSSSLRALCYYEISGLAAPFLQLLVWPNLEQIRLRLWVRLFFSNAILFVLKGQLGCNNLGNRMICKDPKWRNQNCFWLNISTPQFLYFLADTKGRLHNPQWNFL